MSSKKSEVPVSDYNFTPTGRWDGGTLTPHIDVAETDGEISAAAELPGLDVKDIEITIAGDVLTVKGEKKVENEKQENGVQYRERRFGSFSRMVRLPFDASDADVNATYDKGVLTIRIPKPEGLSRKVRKVDVKAIESKKGGQS